MFLLVCVLGIYVLFCVCCFFLVFVVRHCLASKSKFCLEGELSIVDVTCSFVFLALLGFGFNYVVCKFWRR